LPSQSFLREIISILNIYSEDTNLDNLLQLTLPVTTKRKAARRKKYRKLLTGLEKSGNPPASDGTAKRSILCLIRFFDSTILYWSSVAPSDSALKYFNKIYQLLKSKIIKFVLNFFNFIPQF
jgi:hypothetical protein